MTLFISHSLWFFLWPEYAEVDAAVSAVFDKSGHVFKRIVLAMLENEHAARFQQTAFKDEPGQRRQFGQGVRRVGEDEVELLVAALQEAEHVAAQGHTLVRPELLEALADESVMVAVGLNAYD